MKYSWLFLMSLWFISCTDVTPRRPIHRKHGQKKEYSVAFNKALNKYQESIIQEYIAKDSLLTYQNSAFGFVYGLISPSKNKKQKVKKGDKVVFLKTVYSLKDELIYKEQKITTEIGKSTEIVGVQEGLKLMQEDEEIKFIFTSFVAHGFHGDKHRIGRNTPLIVIIKLLTIN